MSRLVAVLTSLPSLCCIGVAAAMALNGVGGWGWLLFVALLLSPDFKFDFKVDDGQKKSDPSPDSPSSPPTS